MARSRSQRSNDPPATWDETLIRRLLPWRIELAGVLLALLSLGTLLTLSGLFQGQVAWWGRLWYQLAGWGAYPLFLSLAFFGIYVALRRLPLPWQPHPTQAIGFELILLAALPITYQLVGAGLPGAYQGRGGGLAGWALAAPMLDFFGVLLTNVFYLSLLLLGLALVARISWEDVSQTLALASEQLQAWAQALEPPPLPPAPPAPAEITVVDKSPSPDAAFFTVDGRDSRLPGVDILDKGTVISLSEDEIQEKKEIIEQTLLDFGLRGEVTEIRRGPSVTQFGVTPGYLDGTGPDGEPLPRKVRVSRIAALRRDFALALAVPRLRIEAPVPGRGTVGLEVPNASISIVRLRTIIESPAFNRPTSPLAVALGQGVSGAPLAIDIARMPHLLIAGTTGSGKSVLLNAFISCLVFNNPPERLKLVMIDPKKVELIRFNGLPHLLGHVEVDHERVPGVLRWLIAEMERRYEAFAHIGAKDLQRYNEKVRRYPDARPLPYIAVFIDELADLMAMFGDEVEQAICRLAQMARATGMHLVLATQRPSTDVITGLIKANFPARISFHVTSNTDSRVILDTVGAEQLMGRGDMLYLSPEAGEPVRVQGCFVSDSEIERLVTHWRQAIPGYEPQEPPWEQFLVREEVISERDDMLEEAIALVQKRDTISTSYIQRRLRVGYPRAARLMEALYEMDLVEDPKEGGKTRRTLVDEDDDPLDDFVEEIRD